VQSAGNREPLRVIAEKAPGSLDELARITGKAKSPMPIDRTRLRGGIVMKLKSMSIDRLVGLRSRVEALLGAKVAAAAPYTRIRAFKALPLLGRRLEVDRWPSRKATCCTALKNNSRSHDRAPGLAAGKISPTPLSAANWG